MNVGSLFSGIGGIELGFEREGFETIWFVEKEPYCQAVLKKHWPKVPVYEDISKLDFSKLPRPDILTGGFPCQDISQAGKMAGLREGKRSSLWKYYAKAIGILRPRIAFIENVPMLASLGLDEILSDIAKAGYDAEWFCLSASQFGALHKRERIFILAYPNSERFDQQRQIRRRQGNASNPFEYGTHQATNRLIDKSNNFINSQFSIGRNKAEHQKKNATEIKRRTYPKETDLEDLNGKRREDNRRNAGQVFVTNDWGERIQRFCQETKPFKETQDVRSVEELFKRPNIPQPLIRRGGNGFSSRLDEATKNNREASYEQKERTQAIGNAVVPQCAQFIARRIKEVLKDA